LVRTQRKLRRRQSMFLPLLTVARAFHLAATRQLRELLLVSAVLVPAPARVVAAAELTQETAVLAQEAHQMGSLKTALKAPAKNFLSKATTQNSPTTVLALVAEAAAAALPSDRHLAISSAAAVKKAPADLVAEPLLILEVDQQPATSPLEA